MIADSAALSAANCYLYIGYQPAIPMGPIPKVRYSESPLRPPSERIASSGGGFSGEAPGLGVRLVCVWVSVRLLKLSCNVRQVF